MREEKNAAPAAVAGPVAAWMTPEGDRVVTEATMAGARKDGGAMLSSMRPYTVALVPAAVAVPDVEFSRFLTDVMTAAGLVEHGKKCKALGERIAEMVMRLRLAQQPAPVAQGDALTDTYVQQVPDKCDRIVWRGRYYHLPIDAAEHSYTEPSPMAKVAAALRQKAEQEDAAYQARRSDQGLMESEWGPMEDAPPHEDPPMHVAVVEGDDAVRTLQWNRDVAAFAYPVGTLLYAARAQDKKGGA